jgi:hypothetical protein
LPNAAICDALSREPGITADLQPPYAEWFAITETLLVEAQRDGEVDPRLEPSAAAVFAVSTFFGLCAAVAPAELAVTESRTARSSCARSARAATVGPIWLPSRRRRRPPAAPSASPA